MINWKTESIPNTNNPMINEATSTTIALLWSSAQVGHETL